MTWSRSGHACFTMQRVVGAEGSFPSLCDE